MSMTQEMLSKLRKSLMEHEGYSNHLYTDSLGKKSIGIGYNIEDRGLPDAFINSQYLEDVNFFYNQLCKFDWYHLLNEDRQIVLIDMAYNLGWKNFLGFSKMIDALSTADYEIAAEEMMNSEWAKQVKGRADCLAKAMLIGIYNI